MASILVDHLLAVIEQGPAGRVPDVAGPQVLTLEEMAETYLRVRGRDAQVRSEPTPGTLYEVFRTGANLCPDRAVGTVTWAAFLQNRGADLERSGHLNGTDYRASPDATE